MIKQIEYILNKKVEFVSNKLIGEEMNIARVSYR